MDMSREKPEIGNDIDLGKILGHGGQLTLGLDKYGKHQRGRHCAIFGGSGVGKSMFTAGIVRQDIDQWHRTHCGLMMLDPHGTIYKGLMEYLAERPERNLPIIPIDLTRDDWIISYNVLRQRQNMSRSVVIAGLIEAITHVWGEFNTNATPRFNNLGSLALDTLFQLGLTLAEASQLLMRHDVQRALIARLSSRLRSFFFSRTRTTPSAKLKSSI
jgi:hypothetical protein